MDLRIFAAIKTVLQAISIAGGYFYDVDDAAVMLDPDQSTEAIIKPNGPRPLIVIRAGSSSDAWGFTPSDQVKVILPVSIVWENRATAGVDASRVEMFAKGSADIERALTRDRSLGIDGVCDVLIQNRTLLVADSGLDLRIEMQVNVELYRTYGEP